MVDSSSSFVLYYSLLLVKALSDNMHSYTQLSIGLTLLGPSPLVTEPQCACFSDSSVLKVPDSDTSYVQHKMHSLKRTMLIGRGVSLCSKPIALKGSIVINLALQLIRIKVNTGGSTFSTTKTQC